MRTIVLILILSVSTLAVAQSVSKPFVADGIYTVSFGGHTPKIIKDTLPGRTGNAERATYVVEQGPAIRMLGTVAPEGGVALDDADTYFDSMVDSIRTGMPGMDVVANRRTTIGVYPARELEANDGQVVVLARMSVTHKGLVFAQAVFPKGDIAGRESGTAFLNSLDIAPEH